MNDTIQSTEKPGHRPALPARGMRDFLPADIRKREYVINIIKSVYESYGFEPLETPAVENLETLMGKYGEEGNQLVFKILKRGEKLDQELAKFSRLAEASNTENTENLENAENSENSANLGNSLSNLALRYDLTVPLARVAANYRNDLPKFFKRYQIQPVWRADRPARGRFREFYQCDVDAIGSSSVTVEAEVIMAVSDILKRLGFKDFTIRLNHRKVLSDILDTAGVPAEKHTDALVAIDKMDKIGREGVKEEFTARGISDTASKMLLDLFEQTQAIHDQEHGVNRTILSNLINIASNEVLTELGHIITYAQGAPVLLDPSLARGLSYYTGAIMEVEVGKEIGSLGGGGRYDGLIGMFQKEEVPACGFSLGLERIIVVMDERGMFPPEIAEANSADVMVTIWPNESVAGSVADSLALARQLRAQGLRVLLYPEADKLGKQFKYAGQINVPYVIVQGDEEKANGTVALKNMQTGDQEIMKPEAVAEKIGRK
jgi:histidyl-tRNA synthetase